MSFLDHRQIAAEMELFFFNEQVGPGLPIWLQNGVAIREALESFIKGLEKRAGYQQVASPHIGKSELYERSGHLQCFRENMFPPIQWPEDNSQYFLKPMNCPHHHMVFSSSPRSYRSLPIRISEYGQVYRHENSGSLHGLVRARGLCQNDAHIYISPDHAYQEMEKVIDLHELCYRKLGLKNYRYRLSKGGISKDFIGEKKLWLEGEAILRLCLEAKGLEYYEAEGEAAFYGPKIDIQMKIGAKDESISSIQLDFVSAERFHLNYIDKDGNRKVPWIIHRAPLGSHERFIAMLLEVYQGQLPAWLAPIQVYILPVLEEQVSEAQKLAEELMAMGIRAKADQSIGHLSKRIHFAHRYRPYSKIILGAKELESGKLKIQWRDEVIEIWRVNMKDELRKHFALE